MELLGTAVDRTWRIALKRGPGIVRKSEEEGGEKGEGGKEGKGGEEKDILDPEVRVVIHCNGVEVMDLLLSDEVCGDSSWRIDYSRTVEEIEFEVYDSASDYFRPAPGNFLRDNCLLNLVATASRLPESVASISMVNMCMVSTLGSPWAQQQELVPGDPATGPPYYRGGAETGDQQTNERAY